MCSFKDVVVIVLRLECFKESGLVGMLEGAVFNSVDMDGTAFIGEGFYIFCYNVVTSPVTTSFTKYAESVNFICHVDSKHRWKVFDVQKLITDLSYKKDVGRNTFRAYINYQKWV